MQCGGTGARRRSSPSGLARVHTAPDDPNHHRRRREGQHWNQVCPQALAATSKRCDTPSVCKWYSRGPRARKGRTERGPPPPKPGIRKAKCIIPSPAHLRDTHRTFTTFIMGKNFATPLGIKITRGPRPWGSRKRKLGRAQVSSYLPGKVQNEPDLPTGP